MRRDRLPMWLRVLGFGAVVLTTSLGEQAPLEAAKSLDVDCGEHAIEGPVEQRAGAGVPKKRGGFEVLPDVTLSTKVTDKLEQLATRYETRTGKKFVVTSGTRDPEDQAEAIYDKLVLGDDILRLYRDKSAAQELKRIYATARGANKPRAATLVELASAIRGQMKRGIFISAHLRAGAADVRSHDMTVSEKRVFVDAVNQVGGLRVLHETTPPHFHLQLQ